MQEYELLVGKLSRYYTHYQKILNIFKRFQSNLGDVVFENEISGVAIEHNKGINSTVFFLDKKFNLVFSSLTKDDCLVGKISFLQELDEEWKEVFGTTYNHQAEVDIDMTPQDVLFLEDEFDCRYLLAHMIYTALQDDISE